MDKIYLSSSNIILQHRMKLITKEFEESFNDYPLYSQEHEEDPYVIVRLFDPCGSASWYLLEYDRERKISFGYVTGLQTDEFGYASITELEGIERPYGMTIELDLYFNSKRLSECLKDHQMRWLR